MQIAHLFSLPSLATWREPVTPASARAPVQSGLQNHCDDRQFIDTLDAYRGRGGLASQTEVTALFVRRNGGKVALLAHWIATRELVCFAWQEQTWLPLFQFNPIDMTPHPQLRALLAELTRVYDPLEITQWFTRPNPWLGQSTPVDTLGSDMPAVMQAACADRFFAAE